MTAWLAANVLRHLDAAAAVPGAVAVDPDYLNHGAHFDLSTLFVAACIDPGARRSEFVGPIEGPRHDALCDFEVVRACSYQLVVDGRFPNASAWLRESAVA